MTLSSAADTIVTIALGLGLGAILSLIPRLTPRVLDEAIKARGKREGRLRGARIRDEELAVLMRDPAAHGWRVATLALIGLVLVLVLTAWLSPIDVVWWKLLAGVVVAGVLFELVFRRARTKNRDLNLPPPLDPLSETQHSHVPTPEPEPAEAEEA